MENLAGTGTTGIKTMEDIFHFKYFYSKIYNETNIYYGGIYVYASGDEIQKEAEWKEMPYSTMNIVFGSNRQRKNKKPPPAIYKWH